MELLIFSPDSCVPWHVPTGFAAIFGSSAPLMPNIRDPAGISIVSSLAL